MTGGGRKIMKKVVVIEDDPDVIALIRDVFDSQNIDACFFSSSTDGLKEIIKTHPDLVIMDLMMPNISGFEICKIIRTNEKLKNIPIMVLTGYDSQKVRKEIFSYGIDDYLAKPFDIQVFIEKVLRFVK
jgi:DNA-binding response OmpR family regulator